MFQKLHSPRWRLHWIREEPHWSYRSTCSQSGNITERNKKTSVFSQDSNMFNKKQCDFNPFRVFWKVRRPLNNIKMRAMKNQMPKQQLMKQKWKTGVTDTSTGSQSGHHSKKKKKFQNLNILGIYQEIVRILIHWGIRMILSWIL